MACFVRRLCILMIDYDAAHLHFSRFNFSWQKKVVGNAQTKLLLRIHILYITWIKWEFDQRKSKNVKPELQCTVYGKLIRRNEESYLVASPGCSLPSGTSS